MSVSRRVISVVGVAALVAAIGAGAYLARRPLTPPTLDAATYQQTVRAFYRGLSSLDVGLLDAAKTEFTRVTELAPGEPAAWANLGLAHLRLSEFDTAARALGEAAARAPESADVAMLQGTLELARGAVDAAIAHLRRAVDDKAPENLRAQYALAAALERARGEAADDEVRQLHEQMLVAQPDNLVVLVDRARVSARRSDVPSLDDSVRRLAARSAGWPPAAMEQLEVLRTAVTLRDFQAAGRALAFLRNVLARVPAFRDNLAAATVPAGLLAHPIGRFLVLPTENPLASPPDLALEFARTPLDTRAEAPVTTLRGWPLAEDRPPTLLAIAGGALLRLDAQGGPSASPAGASTAAELNGVLPLDWNHDFKTDLLVTGPGGTQLLLQRADGTFLDATPPISPPAVTARPSAGAWAADLDMDGDLDAVVSVIGDDPLVLRNNGDGTWRVLQMFGTIRGVRDFAWGDIDRDGDPDSVLSDAAGGLHLFVNQQAGTFERAQPPPTSSAVVALTMGDSNGDGLLDIVTLDRAGLIRGASIARGGWDERQLATWPNALPPVGAGTYRLTLADLDNNGALDVIVAAATHTALWLSDQSGALQPLAPITDAGVHDVLDLDGDGQLDLLAVSEGRPIQMLGRGQRGYHWQTMRVRAQATAGDQRINTFGVGGEIEVRSGTLVQKRILTGAPIHVGLGTRSQVDVARIVWPNGVMQAEFELRVDRPVVAEQRLKGSCPWLFAYDGREMTFVTDVLWRSPLGLRINAQDTADSTQTEDWVTVRGDQLVARDGRYDMRITAELWETHFFDHVSLLAVDRPADVDVFVDERFARSAPALQVRAMTDLTPIERARDDEGRDVTGLLRTRDGQHVGGFEKGPYQGLAREHSLEFELSADTKMVADLWLIARGWVYPTDSSINVAVAQGQREPPHGLALEWRDAAGTWRVLNPDLGFPAGKNKTILIDLSTRPLGTTHFRLRTNMEVYWDWLASARPANDAPLRTTRLALTTAELRYRGFSRTHEDRTAHAPETPSYTALSNTAPRWRDLEGYHTRFGDVMELLAGVDDRYVIMNAGDELGLTFPAPPPPAPGWRRDFVFISDGWEKDGDFNTGYSKTVLPLPSHDRVHYVASSSSLELEDDPVYRRHPDDWQRYHTRFVAPDRYLRGLISRD